MLKFRMTCRVTNSLLQRFQCCCETNVIVRPCMDQQDTSKMVKEVRVALGLTQEQFAAKIGVTVSTVNRWENDKGKPSPLAMLRIGGLQQKINRNK